MRKREGTFGRRLRRLREDLGLRQTELTEILDKEGVSIGSSYISELERSRDRTPTGTVVAAMARALQTTADYLLGLIDDPTPRDAVDVGISPEAEQVARVIDNMTPKRRAEVQAIVNVVAESADVAAMEITGAARDVAAAMAAAGMFVNPATAQQVQRLLIDYAAQVTGITLRYDDPRFQSVGGYHGEHVSHERIEKVKVK